MQRFRVALAGCLSALLVAGLTVASAGSGVAAPEPTPVIVELEPGTDPATFTKEQGITATHLYTEGISGFAAKLETNQLAEVKSDPDVVTVANDGVFARLDPPAQRGEPKLIGPKRHLPGVDPYELDFEQPKQHISTEIKRVRATKSATADIDGRDDRRINVDIAILDSGIDPYHPDLNVVGGFDCVDGPKSERGWYDHLSHGTMVAGEAAAIDNKIGIVGVAPGARLHAVRVTNLDGLVTDSAYLCGLQWLSSNADRIEVANMSFGGDETPLGPCKGKGVEQEQVDMFHQLICRSFNRGVTMTASAGNESSDVAPFTPAAYNEVIAVSATVDFDGKPGGLAPVPPECFPTDVDDTFAVFSNYGKEIDVAAPGVCSLSTYPGGLYAVSDGTSFAAPLVAGGAALLLSRKPDLPPEQVRARILRDAAPGPIPGDPDKFPEGILDVKTF